MSVIRQRLAAGQIVRTMHFTQLPSPKLVEIVGVLAGSQEQLPGGGAPALLPTSSNTLLHGIWIDQEHSAVSHSDLELMLIACRAVGLDAFARVPPADYTTIMRPLEAGCSGVMIAQVRSLEEVRNGVAWAKYPPAGIRGMFGGNYEAGFGRVNMATHVARANQDRWVAIQIETAEAADLVDQIAGTPGVDMLFVGPADLSVTLGVPGQFLHPKCVEVLERTSAACKKHNKPWGTLSRDVEHARTCRALGCQLFSVFGDLDCVAAGLRAIDEKFKDIR